jgi:hypothetical protein
MNGLLKKQQIKHLCLFLTLLFFVSLFSFDTSVNAQPSPYRYDHSRNFISYHQSSDGNYYYNDYMTGLQNLGPNPAGKEITVFFTPITVPDYETVTDEMDYMYGWRASGRSDSLLNRPPLPEYEEHYVANAIISTHIVSGDTIQPVVRVKLKGPDHAYFTGTSYREYIGFVYEYTDNLYLQDPILWEIENGLRDPEVKAQLDVTSIPSKLSWSYIDYENNVPKEELILLSGTRSKAIPHGIQSYNFSVIVDGNNDTKTNSNGIYSNYYSFRPNDLRNKDRVQVIGSLTITDTKGNIDSTMITENIPIEVTNHSPTANFSISSNPSGYYYASRPITITDNSYDPENDMAQVNWTITNSAGNTVLIVYQTVGDSGPYFFYANPDYLEADGFDKNGSFEDETWSSPVPIDASNPENVRAIFKPNANATRAEAWWLSPYAFTNT